MDARPMAVSAYHPDMRNAQVNIVNAYLQLRDIFTLLQRLGTRTIPGDVFRQSQEGILRAAQLLVVNVTRTLELLDEYKD